MNEMNEWDEHLRGCKVCQAAAKSARSPMCPEGVQIWIRLTPEQWAAARRALGLPRLP